MLMEERSNLLVVLVSATMLLSACTSNPAPQIRPVEMGTQQKPGNTGNSQIPPSGSSGSGSSQGSQTESGAIKTSIQARDLQKANIELKDLRYKFSYLTIVREGDMVFTNGAAAISIDGLPIGQEGVLSLDVYQRGNKVLAGSVAAVKLQAGSQTINLALQPLSGQTSNVIINAVIDTGTSTPPPGPTPTPTPIAPPPPTATPDPLNGLNWDGKSFLGNDKWELIPVN